MSTATILEVEAMPERAPDARSAAADMPVAVPEVHDAQRGFYRASRPQHDPLFNADQQKAFNKAFQKREAKLRRQFEQMRKDLLDTLGVTHQLLGICSDRISVADERAIRGGLNDIRLAYGGKKQCPNPQQQK